MLLTTATSATRATANHAAGADSKISGSVDVKTDAPMSRIHAQKQQVACRVERRRDNRRRGVLTRFAAKPHSKECRERIHAEMQVKEPERHMRSLEKAVKI